MGGDRKHEGVSDLARVGDVLFGADRQVCAWVAERIPGFHPDPQARALGVVKNRSMVAAVVFERYNGVHVEASIAAESGSGWADRRTLHALFFYPFVTLGCEAITVLVPCTNLSSINLATKLGFTMEAIVTYAAHDGGGLLVLKMLRNDCPWIPLDGKRQQGARGT